MVRLPADLPSPIRYHAVRPSLAGWNAIRSIETASVHHAARRRGCGVAARGARAAVSIEDASHIDPAAMWDHFRQALRALGYVEGRNIAIEYRSTEERSDRLVAAATEPARLPVDVIVSFGSPATQAAKQATTTIPIVMVAIGDPIRAE